MSLRDSIQTEIKGFMEADLEQEYYFGYFGRCRVEAFAHDLAERICLALPKVEEGLDLTEE